MKSLTLFKQTKHVQLGHLYEHIFCDQIIEYLFNKGVYASIDYVLDGKTYNGGIIEIEFAAYRDIAVSHLPELRSLSLNLNDEVMHTAWNQVESEKQMIFGHNGQDAIMDGLKELDATPWLSFDELDVIDVSDARRRAKPFYVLVDKLKATKFLTIEFRLSSTANTRKLLPLANRIFGAIGTNLQFFLTRELGIYFDDESMHYDKKRMIYRLKFKTYPEFKITDGELAEAIKYIVIELHQHDAFERLCNQLKTIPRSSEYWTAPPTQWLYESTLQVVGTKGWERIATKTNCTQVIEMMQVTAKFGKQSFDIL